VNQLSLDDRKAAEATVASKGSDATAQELLLAIYAALKSIDYQLYKARTAGK
jgi:hypothetical protein